MVCLVEIVKIALAVSSKLCGEEKEKFDSAISSALSGRVEKGENCIDTAFTSAVDFLDKGDGLEVVQFALVNAIYYLRRRVAEAMADLADAHELWND